MQNQPRSTAIHEAGHAVIARILRLPCGDATIKPDHESAGHNLIADPYAVVQRWEGEVPGKGARPHGTYDSAVLARILAFMAGRAAEEEIIGACLGGDSDDKRQIGLMLDELPRERLSPSPEHYEKRLRSLACGLVRRHRGRIERVAAALMRKGSLTGDEIDALVAITFPKRPVRAQFSIVEIDEEWFAKVTATRARPSER
jgi:hypothetical protein